MLNWNNSGEIQPAKGVTMTCSQSLRSKRTLSGECVALLLWKTNFFSGPLLVIMYKQIFNHNKIQKIPSQKSLLPKECLNKRVSKLWQLSFNIQFFLYSVHQSQVLPALIFNKTSSWQLLVALNVHPNNVSSLELPVKLGPKLVMENRNYPFLCTASQDHLWGEPDPWPFTTAVKSCLLLPRLHQKKCHVQCVPSEYVGPWSALYMSSLWAWQTCTCTTNQNAPFLLEKSYNHFKST